MALAERAELVARLSLKDDFSKQARGISRNFAGSMANIQKAAVQGARSTATNLGRIGAVTAGFVALNVKQGLSSLAELEDAVTSVDGAIKTVGKGWTTTGQQIAAMANEIETNVQRAFDDKEITQATENLIRYGGLAEKNLRPAMEVMTDLAAKTGDVGGASAILAKALAAPEKAAGKLTRMGIVLTKQQQKQITALTDAGKAAEAQALLLDILAGKTKGAAAAMAGPYRDSLNILRDVTEDAQRALGEAFLPVISRVADKLSTELAKPETLQNLRDFGKQMAGAFDKILEVGGRIPWAQIGDSMKLAGTGAKAVFDMFTSMPPWVQTAVLTGWGLNKLTGGALGSIVGELGKGLIKGVLGMNAGVVNIKAGTVTGGGGAPTKGGGRSFIGGLGGFLGTVAIAATSIAILSELMGQREQQSKENVAAGERLNTQTQEFAGAASVKEMVTSLSGIEAYQKQLATELTPESLAYALNIDGVADRINQTKETLRQAIATGVERTKGAIDWGANRTTAAISRIPAPKTNVTVNVSSSVTVTATSVRRSLYTSSTYSTNQIGARLGAEGG